MQPSPWPTEDDWRDWIDRRTNTHTRSVQLNDSNELPPGVAYAYTPEGADLLIDSSSVVSYDAKGVYLYLLARPVFEALPLSHGLIERYLDTALGVAEHRRFYLPSLFHGGGHAKQMMSRAAGLYGALGISRVELVAQSVGKYIWANCGFDFATYGDCVTVNSSAAVFARELGILETWVDIPHPWLFAALDRRDGKSILVPRQTLLDALVQRGGQVPQLPPDVPGFALSKVLLIHSGCFEWAGTLDLNPRSVGCAWLKRYTGGYA